MAVEVLPIDAADLPEVGRFLHTNHNDRIAPADWVRAVQVPWTVASPNHGFALRDADRLVGVYLAYYSDREINGQLEHFCNLGAWCVLESHRAHGMKLLMAMMRQRGFHFTDLSPSGNVVPLNRKLKFTDLDTTTSLMVNLPWHGRGAQVIDDPATIETVLTGTERAIYLDHRDAAAAHHLVLRVGTEHCYVIFRDDTRRRVRAFASVLHVGNPELFHAALRPLGSHLLLRHQVAATLLEHRVIGGKPSGCAPLRKARPKMFKSATLSADQIDYLYSELTCLAW